MKTVFKNAKVILQNRVLYGGIRVEGSRITEVFEKGAEPEGGRVIDCNDLYLSPGFIDLHVHGGGGADFMDGTKESVETVLHTHARHGTTSMLPTTLSSSKEKVAQALLTIEQVQRSWTSGPRILGAHVEGNFFSPVQAGAQDPEYIFPPTKENTERILTGVSNIRRISCAPEVEHALAFAREMSGKGILMSAAHTDASYDEMEQGAENGFSHMTHLFNGCSIVHSPNYYCRAGAAESALVLENMAVELIADGRHVPRELLKLVYRMKGAERINLCTDAMCAADMPEGEYKLGALDVVIQDKVAVLKDGTSFAGSICTGDRAVRTMYQNAEVPIYEAVKMMTATPAKLIRVYEELGSITVGKYADLNLFDEEVRIRYTMINGEEYQNNL